MNRYRRRDAAALSTFSKSDPLHTISRMVTWLISSFFGLSIAFFMMAAFAEAQHPDSISIYVWGRAVTELILGIVYYLFAYLWRRGKFWGYLRLLMTSALAAVSTLSIVVLYGTYPWWLRLEQFLQLLVILALFYTLIRPVVRKRFTKKTLGVKNT